MKLADLPDFQYLTNHTLKSSPFKMCVDTTDLCHFHITAVVITSVIKIVFFSSYLDHFNPLLNPFPPFIFQVQAFSSCFQGLMSPILNLSLALSFMFSVFQWISCSVYFCYTFFYVCLCNSCSFIAMKHCSYNLCQSSRLLPVLHKI